MNKKIVNQIFGNDFCYVDAYFLNDCDEPENIKENINRQIVNDYDWFIYLKVKKYSFTPGSIIIAKNKSRYRDGCIDCYDEFRPLLKRLERALKYNRILDES